MASPVIQVRITDPALDEWMDEQCKRRGMSRSAFVRLVLVKAMEGDGAPRAVTPSSTNTTAPAPSVVTGGKPFRGPFPKSGKH